METNLQNHLYSIADNDVTWFQYHILYKILGTKDYFKKLKISTDTTCYLCNLCEENVEHLFLKCEKTTELWNNIQQWINIKVPVNLSLTSLMKLLGYLVKDESFWPLNFILMITRKYIFWCSKKGTNFIQKEIKKCCLEQTTLSLINLQSDRFNKRWNIWKNVFVGIESQ